MPGFSFPSVGPLGLGSPPSRPSTSGLRYYDPLRLPLLRLGSLRFSLVSRYLALSLLCLFPYRLALRVRKITLQRLASFIFRFAWPGFIRKEMAALSSAQSSPVCTCPARGLRWCPFDLPSHLQDACLPAQPDRRLSPAFAGLSSWTTIMNFSELCYAAYTLATPGFTHNLAVYACRFAADSAAHLIGWDLYNLPYAPTG